jgi:uracil-DNA glycosylase family 4
LTEEKPEEKGEKRMDLETLAKRYEQCTMCPLHQRRTQVVMGEGNPRSPLMIVGEGPGADEDRQGRPFVGKAGQLLNKILEAAEIPRQEIFITNIVKCRPPGNRTPKDEEMNTCISILRQQFVLIRPKIIVTLGAAPTRALIDPSARITRVRGKMDPAQRGAFHANLSSGLSAPEPKRQKGVLGRFQADPGCIQKTFK